MEGQQMSTDLGHSDALLEWRRLATYVQSIVAATWLWDRVLTSDQRTQLGGDFQTAYAVGGTIGMWTRLHRVPVGRAIIELASSLELIVPSTGNRLLRELGEREILSTGLRLVPSWHPERGELLLAGEVVRRVARHSKNLRPIIASFQELGWPLRIDDPLTGGPNSTRLNGAIGVLNTGLDHLRFHADGTGTGICWELI
jgi:hypothetical protein